MGWVGSMASVSWVGLGWVHKSINGLGWVGLRKMDPCPSLAVLQKNTSGDEIANVNFLYDDIVHSIQNTIRLVHS